MRSNTSRVASATTRRGPLLSPDVHHCTPHRTGVDLTGHTAHHFAPWRCRPGWSYHGRYSVHRCTPLPALLRSLPSAQSPRRLPTASLTGFDSPIVCSQNSVLLTPFGGSCFHTRRSAAAPVSLEAANDRDALRVALMVHPPAHTPSRREKCVAFATITSILITISTG